MNVMNPDSFYDCLTEAMIAARQAEDFEAADEIEAALETLNPFAVGYICTTLADA